MTEKVRGTKFVIVLSRDDDGKPTETIEREVPREVATKLQYRSKSDGNAVFDCSGTVRVDLSDSGLRGERSGLIDVKYIEGGVFVDDEDE